MAEPTWEHLATFVSVARAGSLTAGAQRRGISQPTAGRHIAALEEALGVTLFVRHARGLSLTDEGAQLSERAEDIAQRVQALLRNAHETESEASGSVRVSAAEPIGAHAITPALRVLRERHPGLGIELVIDNSPANLSRREADVAVRMFEPTQLDLVARRIGAVELGMFATRRYLERHGAPQSISHPSAGAHTFIGHDRDALWHRAIHQLGLSSRDFAYRCDNILAQMQAVRDSVGIGVMHAPLAARDPELRRVLPALQLPPLDIWLVMHRDLRGNPAVRATFEQLVEALTAYVHAPGPPLFG